VRLKLRYPPFRTLTRQVRMPTATHDDMTIYKAALGLMEDARPADQPVRLIGVGVSDFVEQGHPVQAQLFGSAQSDGRVDQTLDAIRERFGRGAARRGRGGNGSGTS